MLLIVKELLVKQELLAHKAHKERLAPKGHRVLKVQQGVMESMEQMELKAHKERLVPKGLKVHREHRVLKVQQEVME